MFTPLEITQILSTTPDRAFTLFSHRDHLAKWWGPKGMEMKIKTFDFRSGGIFHYLIKAGNGFEMWGKFTYLEIEAPNRITLINSFPNADAETVPAPIVPFGADWPLEMWTEYRFEPSGDQTLLRLTSYPLNASDASNQQFFENHDNMRLGFKGTFDALSDYLKTLQ
ncbi:SRPBCC domain-containing protein [Algoriphagus lacus]|uniref:SRPBCC domain-containing protein n=1 Tax=Algoriphagus lacus TaxID=2056311 RepID=A0A418PSN3_9BACT|nr:SRPBCC domain-containing protein [Algoriphagus lacus]RIW15870.1 SRPBCC domain-containing protein [Algoriphagus lacus]